MMARVLAGSGRAGDGGGEPAACCRPPFNHSIQPVWWRGSVLGEPIGQSLGQDLLNGDTLPTLPGRPAALLVNGERNVRIEMAGNHDGLRAAWLTAAARRVLPVGVAERSGKG